jgi:integrase
MSRTAAKPWERQLRSLVTAAHGRGWSLGPHRGGRTQITRRWSDGTRSSVTLATPWAPSSGPALLALVERLAGLMAEQQIGLSAAAALVDVAGAGRSADTIRTGAVDWPAVVERYRRQMVEATGAVQASTWAKHQARYMREALEVLARRPAPRDGRSVLEAVLAAHPTPPGKQGRRERLGHVARFLDFAVRQCGAPARYRPPEAMGELIGKRLDRAEAATPLMDDQFLRLYRAAPDPSWRLGIGLAGVFGLRPVEIALCRPEGKGLRVQGVKRNASGRSADRLVQALDPAGAAGLGAELLAQLAEHGPGYLPQPSERTPLSTRLGDYLDGKVPAWAQLREEAASTGQGHLTAYGLRHGFAWRGGQLYGLSARVLAVLMGHTVLVHQRHYGAWMNEAEALAAVEIARARLQQAAAVTSVAPP